MDLNLGQDTYFVWKSGGGRNTFQRLPFEREERTFLAKSDSPMGTILTQRTPEKDPEKRTLT